MPKLKPLIVANWKMNPPTLQGAKLLFNAVERGIRDIKNVEVVVCPPFLFILNLKSKSRGPSKMGGRGRDARASRVAGAPVLGRVVVLNLKLGGQSCFWEDKGAFTGEISPKMLKNLGCDYVILGHSERRRYFQESDEMINKKIKAALKSGLKPILCVGETEEERKTSETTLVLKNQLQRDLKGILNLKSKILNLSIAYEPVWAIGTGNPCSTEEAKKTALFIRKVIAKMYSPFLAKSFRVLYGGSVNKENAADYIKEAAFQGLLVGGASLDAGEFIQIINSVAKK